jgi:hypothetical protein
LLMSVRISNVKFIKGGNFGLYNLELSSGINERS